MARRSTILSVLALLCLQACGARAPAGQVVAVIGDEEITRAEVRTEAAARGSSPADSLRAVIDRKLWAREARRAQFDRQVDYVLLQRRADEAVLAGMLTRSIAASVSVPGDRALDRFLAEHPAAFASHTLFAVDRIDARVPEGAALADRLRQAPSLDAAQNMLARVGVAGRRSRAAWDSLSIPADLAARLTVTPPGTPFFYRSGDMLMIGTLRARRDLPLDLRRRRALLQETVRQRRIDAAIERRLARLRAATPIRYQPAVPAPR